MKNNWLRTNQWNVYERISCVEKLLKMDGGVAKTYSLNDQKLHPVLLQSFVLIHDVASCLKHFQKWGAPCASTLSDGRFALEEQLLAAQSLRYILYVLDVVKNQDVVTLREMAHASLSNPTDFMDIADRDFLMDKREWRQNFKLALEGKFAIAEEVIQLEFGSFDGGKAVQLVYPGERHIYEIESPDSDERFLLSEARNTVPSVTVNRADLVAKPDQTLLDAGARFVSKLLVGLVRGISMTATPTITAKSVEFLPQFEVETQWQAIGLALYQHATHLESIRKCARLRCGKYFVLTRRDKGFCHDNCRRQATDLEKGASK